MHEIDPELIRACNREWFTRGLAKRDARREPLVCEGRVVGFVTPRLTRWGWRHGPIYVLPEFRRRGLVLAYYAAHPERRCVAFVADDNLASRAMHERAGFVNWRRGNGGWFMLREPLA